MACKLKREPGGAFSAPAGSKIAVNIRSDKPAQTVSISYAVDQQDSEEPYEFTVRKGSHVLELVALGVEENQRMTLVEVSEDKDCPLKKFSWSSEHHKTAIDVKGT
jgi:hypothetical protein